MHFSMHKLRDMRIGTKLSLGNFAMVSLVLAVFVAAIIYSVSRTMEAQAAREILERTQLLARLVESSDQDLRKRTVTMGKAFQGTLKGVLALDTQQQIDIQGKPSPALMLGNTPVNLDFALVDNFTAATDAVATIFARNGDDFIRVTTSLKNAEGGRAVGTMLDRAHPAYKLMLAGDSFTGLANLFGRQYMTQYNPVRDAQSKVIGITFVGVDFSDYLANLKTSIRELPMGQTGFFYVLDAREGANLGRLVVHPKLEGQSGLEFKDANGQEITRAVLTQKNGTLRYSAVGTAGDGGRRDTMLGFAEVKGWNWVVVGSALAEEFTSEVRALRIGFALAGAFLVLVISGALYGLLRRLVVAPLERARAAAQSLSAGDLTVKLEIERQDEVGVLMASMNQIGNGLASVVVAVRQGSEGVATASAEISEGNHDLSARTEQQASALQQTASRMEELGATVRQNLDSARQANQMAQSASAVATRGGEEVTRVVDTMKGINESSKRIADIISVIDGIAFQTNILALNAAVEAARAGEQGRGFAVVASEVRSLAGRSAEAAKEIKQLIQASVERVEAGSLQVDRAGATMTEVVNSIQRVTDIMGEISAASGEQSDGVAQVAEAVTQMDQSTQQNAALVEQMAAAASSLKSQALELVQTVAVFKTHSAGGRT